MSVNTNNSPPSTPDSNPYGCHSNIGPARLADEIAIVWLVPMGTMHRYVRESLDEFCSRRHGRPRFDRDGVLLGYSELSRSATSRSGHFARRVFWLKNHSDPYPSGHPYEACDPLLLGPGVPGIMTPRAAGRPALMGPNQ